MRVTLERTGGFAGVRLSASVDTDKLPSADAQRLRQLVANAHFFSLPETISTPVQQPDRFQYKVTVLDGGRAHTVTAGEVALPASLRPLTDFLTLQDRRG